MRFIMDNKVVIPENNFTKNPTEAIIPVSKNNIKNFVLLGIIVTSALISITFIISWVLWLKVFHDEINQIIALVNNVITSNGINFNLTFKTLTMVVLGFSVTLALTTFPFIFLKKNSIITLVLGIVLLVISSLLIIGTILFFSFGYSAFSDYVLGEDSIVDILFFAVPVILEMLFCVALVGFSILLILGVFKGGKNTVDLVLPITNKTQENTNPNVSSTVGSLPNQPGQGINIVINTSNSSPHQSPQPFIAVIPSTTTNNPVLLNEQKPSPVPINVPNEQIPLPVITTSQVRWSAQQIEDVWDKGEIIPNVNPSLYRKDYAGALMFKQNFLNNVSFNDAVKSLNWTIMHQKPLAVGGSNDISNLVPLNNNNAVSKSNNYPKWKTRITYNGKENVLKQKRWKHKK